MNILIIDDEKNICTTIKEIFEDDGHFSDFALTFKNGLQKLKNNIFDIVFLDIWLPDKDGIAGLQEIKSYLPEVEVIMISGHGNIENAVESIKYGAYDFLEKPLSLERILLVVKHLEDKINLTQDIRELKLNYIKKYDLLGRDSKIIELKNKIEKIAQTNARVLITGENGTGKEHVARLLHLLSKRHRNRFVEVNCSAIPSELMESEMFGHEAGAFTGAINTKKGLFEMADEGTVFLDEIGDMEPNLQSKLLRVLETGEFNRIGSTNTIKTNFRLICATNKNLEDEIEHNNFREDLYYRINVVPLDVPPLRERVEDIPLLSEYFIKESCGVNGLGIKTINNELMNAMKNYQWPGNVRQLKNIIERMVVLSESDNLTMEDAPNFLNNEKNKINNDINILFSEFEPLKTAKDIFEKEYLKRVLDETNWNISKASKILQIERTYLHKKLKFYSLEKSVS